MTSTKDKVADAAASARPYVERALRDQELRDNVRNAYSSARGLYDQLFAKRDVSDLAVNIAVDEEVRSEVKKIVDELRQAAGRVQSVLKSEPEPARAARNALLLIAGIAIGLLFNPLTGPPLRRFLGRKLFGGKNGFVYRDSNGTPLS